MVFEGSKSNSLTAVAVASDLGTKLCVFFFFLQVSHDFAVNFDEDNPECAGESW